MEAYWDKCSLQKIICGLDLYGEYVLRTATQFIFGTPDILYAYVLMSNIGKKSIIIISPCW